MSGGNAVLATALYFTPKTYAEKMRWESSVLPHLFLTTVLLGELTFELTLPEEGESQCGLLVSLRKNRSTCLLQNVQPGQVRCFLSNVHVPNLAFC